MRFSTQQPQLYCGIDVPARTMEVCSLDPHGTILVHRNMQASPEMLLQASAPSRAALGVWVAGRFPGDWLADLCAQEEIAFVLGHARSLQAMHGGKAKNDTIDSHKRAVLLRGGMLPAA